MGLDVTGRYRYPPPNAGWLALRQEEALEPEIRIIDSHHHLWIENDVPYLLDELSSDLSGGHRIEATVFVQAHFGYRETGPEALRPVGETEAASHVRAEAKQRGLATDVAAGIVGFVDLSLGEACQEVIEAHMSAAPGSFKGVRHSVSRDPNFPDGIVIRPAPPGLLANPAYRAGLRTVRRAGLTYDAMLYHGQIDELVDCAKALSDLPIVLDHYGCVLGVGPYEGRPAGLMKDWKVSLARLAECPNVSVKLGGLGMIVCGAKWHLEERPPTSEQLAADWRWQFETTVELFGTRRCMLESNFPVDKAMWSYTTLWNAFKRLTKSFSHDERNDLFHATADRFYGLGLQ